MTISGEDGSIYVDLLRGTACALTKHFEMPLADALYTSVRHSMSLLCQSVGSACFAMSRLFTDHQLKDPYNRSLSTSICNFYASLRNGGNPLCDMKHAEAIVQACEMTVQALKKSGNSA